MQINCTWFGDNFNVELSSQQGKEPFLVIKGCRIKDGQKGEFVSWPANPPKEHGGKWWNHVYASEAFAVAVIEAAKKAQPAKDTRTLGERKRPDAPF